MSGVTLAAPLKLAEQAGHPRRELLRDRLRGAAPGLLRGGLGRLRHGGGGRRREGQGRWLPGPERVPDPERRHAAHGHRGRHVLAGRAGVRREVRHRARPSCAAPSPASRRRTTPNGAKNERAQFRREMSRRCHLRDARGRRHALGVRLRRGGRRRRRRDRRAGRGRLQVHRQADLREGARRWSPATARGLSDPDFDYTHLRRVRGGRPRTPTPRPASPIRAPSWRWPRCTTASPRPSSC